MVNPIAFSAIPITTAFASRVPDDNGGVHINSGHSESGVLPGCGGRHAIASRASAVQGVGAANREQIEKVFYRAFVFLLPASANFSTARAATIQAARDLYGANSARRGRDYAGLDRRGRQLRRPFMKLSVAIDPSPHAGSQRTRRCADGRL